MNKVNVKPLSVNNCWRGRRFKTQEYKAYEEEVLYKLFPLVLPPSPYQMDIQVGFSSKASDIDNILKPFLDILQKKYGFDDKLIFKLIVEKEIVKKGQEYIAFNISSYIDEQ